MLKIIELAEWKETSEVGLNKMSKIVDSKDSC